MKRLDKFILKSFIGPFIAILLVVIFIFLMQFLWLYIDEIVGKGLGMRVILEFMLWGACTMLPISLPLSTLLASMMTLGNMGENSELTALKAAGISFTRIMFPIMCACAVISLAAFDIGNNLVPYATNQIMTFRDDLSKTKSEIKIPTGTFYDGIDGYVLRVSEQDGDIMKGVMVYDHSNNKGNTSVTVADSGIMKLSKAKDYLTFTLYDGTNFTETNTKKYRDTTLALQKITFARQDMIIPLKNYSFQKSDTTRFGTQAKSQKLSELRHSHDSLSRLWNESYGKHVEERQKSLGLKFPSQLDTAFLKKYKYDFAPDDYMQWKNLSDEKNAYAAAARTADDLANTFSTYNIEQYEYIFYLRRTDVELWKKFAQALACLILFFIGAPVGALIRKGGLGVSAIVSILFFVLYWVVDITGTKLAKDGAISAFNGDFISAYVLLPLGAYLSWKAIHDSSIGGIDTLKNRWRSLKAKFMSIFKKTRIVYMGTPEFSVGPLDALLKKGHNIVGVVTVPDKPVGRGLKMSESAVKKYAVEKGLTVLQPEKLKDPEFLESLAALKADLFVVVGFRMLPEVVWSMPKLGTFNLHAALLPQYRGAAPINWAIINGERISGVTTFMIDSHIDTGGIIFRQEVKIEETDNAEALHDKLMKVGSQLVVDTVEAIVEGNVETRVQRSFIQGAEYLKPAPKIGKELCHIDWNDSTKQIYNLVRGLSPYPTAYTFLKKDDGEPVQLKIFEGRMCTDEEYRNMACACGYSSETELRAGKILSDGKKYFAICTADGAYSITSLQLAGKKRMDVKAFLAGFREPMSYSTVPGTSAAEIEKTRVAK